MNNLCGHCGKQISQNDKFCMHCGAKLERPDIIPIEAGSPMDKIIKKTIDWKYPSVSEAIIVSAVMFLAGLLLLVLGATPLAVFGMIGAVWSLIVWLIPPKIKKYPYFVIERACINIRMHGDDYQVEFVAIDSDKTFGVIVPEGLFEETIKGSCIGDIFYVALSQYKNTPVACCNKSKLVEGTTALPDESK